MAIIKGTIQATKQREKNYSILINDVWMSGLRQCPVSKGDEVMVDTVPSKDGKYINIINIETMDSTIKQTAGDKPIPSKIATPISPASAKDDMILYSVCLKVAGTILSAQQTLPTPAGVVMFADDLFKEVRKR